MAEEIIRAAAGAFFGTVGFAMLVHVPRRAWFLCGVIASFSYLVYWGFLHLGLSDPSAIFLGSLFGALAGQLCARRMKIIGTVFLVSAIVPVVPGLAMTNAVQDTMRGDMVSGLSHGVQAILTACLIAGGALLAVEIMRLLTGGAV